MPARPFRDELPVRPQRHPSPRATFLHHGALGQSRPLHVGHEPSVELSQELRRVGATASTGDVVLAQQRDLDAFERLVRCYQGPLFQLAFRMVGDSGDAEDVLQESLVLAWQGLPRLAAPITFPAWIYRITTRQSLNQVRTRERRRVQLWDGLGLEDLVVSGSASSLASAAIGIPEAAVEAAEQQHDMQAVLLRVPVSLRVCWVLHELHDLTYAEIAGVIKEPVSTVRGRIARARAHLIALLAT